MLSARANGGSHLIPHIIPTPTDSVELNNLKKYTLIARKVPRIIWISFDRTAPADYDIGRTEIKYENMTVGNGYSRIVSQI